MSQLVFGINYGSHINRFTGEPEPMAFGTPDSVILTKETVEEFRCRAEELIIQVRALPGYSGNWNLCSAVEWLEHTLKYKS